MKGVADQFACIFGWLRKWDSEEMSIIYMESVALTFIFHIFSPHLSILPFSTYLSHLFYVSTSPNKEKYKFWSLCLKTDTVQSMSVHVWQRKAAPVQSVLNQVQYMMTMLKWISEFAVFCLASPLWEEMTVIHLTLSLFQLRDNCLKWQRIWLCSLGGQTPVRAGGDAVWQCEPPSWEPTGHD